MNKDDIFLSPSSLAPACVALTWIGGAFDVNDLGLGCERLFNIRKVPAFHKFDRDACRFMHVFSLDELILRSYHILKAVYLVTGCAA